MTDEVTPSATEGAPETVAADAPPDDYKAYVKWRKTGALPPREEPQPPAAAAEEPPAKTEPQSGADDHQPSEEKEEEDEGPERPRSNGRVRRIDRLTRENEQLKAQLAQAQQPKPAVAEPTPKPAEPPGKPHLRDFPTLESYQEALTDWKMDQREAERRNAAAAEKIQAGWQSAETAARTAHPDYDEIIQSVRAPDGPGVPAMRQAMLEDEAGGEILYHLATHPEELSRIAQLAPVSAVREIGKLAARLTSPSPDAETLRKPPVKVSSAPRPPAPLSRPSGQAVKDSVYDEEVAADYTRWAKVRTAQLKGK